MNSSEEEATAYHEAGHAAMGCILGRPPLCVSIVPDAHGNVGQTIFPNDWPNFEPYSSASLKKREYIEIRVLTEVAATFANDLKFPGRSHDSGDNQDEASARDMIQHVNVLDREEYLQCMRRKARGLIAQHWPWIEAVALAHIEKRKLRGCDLWELRP
jgi:hypothetical protein